MSPWSYTNGGGTELDLEASGDYEVQRWDAFGVPALAVQSVGRYARPGAVLMRATIPERRVRLMMWVLGTSEADHDTNMEALIDHMAGSYGRNEPRFGVLKYTRPDASVRSLRCIAAGGLSKPEGERLTATLSRLNVEFHADHPNWYNPTEQSTTATIGTGGAVTWPVTWPVTWGLDGQSGSATVAYAGSAESRSLQWEVAGPCTAPNLYNATVGRYVSLPNLTVPSGLTLRVRMGWRPDGVSDIKAVLVSAGGSETSVIGYLGAGSRFFRLEPGNNSLVATQSNEAATVHTLEWFDEFLSA